MRYNIILSFFFSSYFLTAQDTTHLKNKAHPIFRFYYQNDFYTNTDYYFTQGEQMEFIHPVFDRFFLRKILLATSNSISHTGIAFHGGGYTPKILDTAGILYGDRPFSAYMYLGYFRENTSVEKNIYIRSEIAIGCIGPEALGKATQVYIHEQTGNKIPLGWCNEIHRDLVVQYDIEARKLLLSFFKVPVLWCEGKIHLGTMRDNISLGLKIDGESLSAIFGAHKRNFFLSPVAGIYATAVGYDALMQGGLFNQSSPYIIPPGQTERLLANGNAGIKMRYKKVQAAFTLEWIDPEFKGGSSHRWGDFRLILFL